MLMSQTRGRSRRIWRLVLDGERAGSLNMALDDALTRACEQGGQPTLRLYGWSRPTLSLGRNQNLALAADLLACRRLGVDVVRRPTGGRAILHEHEITYAVSVPSSDALLALGARAALGRLADGIARGLGRLGVRVKRQRSRPQAGRALAAPGAPCFATAARDELTVGGTKVAAAAQWRLRHALLQHGSIPLIMKPARLMQVIGIKGGNTSLPVGAAAGLLRRLPAAAQAGGESEALRSLRQRVIDSLIEGFEEVLEIRLRPHRLLTEEMAAARALEERSYASSAWIGRR